MSFKEIYNDISNIYSNFTNEFCDALSEKNGTELKNMKTCSIALKIFGAIAMSLGTHAAINCLVNIIPSGSLGLVATIHATTLLVLGYDCAQIGHTLRQMIDRPVKKTFVAVADTLYNVYNKGFDKGLTLSMSETYFQNTILMSRISKICLSLVENNINEQNRAKRR